MSRTRIGRISTALATAGAVLAVAVPSHAALTAPVPQAPADGMSVGALPVFSWTPVAGAERYDILPNDLSAVQEHVRRRIQGTP